MAEQDEWTVGTLKEHVLKLMAEYDRRYQQQFTDSKEAVDKALESLNKRLDGMNEFRNTLKDQESKYLTRSDAVALSLLICTGFGLLLEILNFAFF